MENILLVVELVRELEKTRTERKDLILNVDLKIKFLQRLQKLPGLYLLLKRKKLSREKKKIKGKRSKYTLTKKGTKVKGKKTKKR